MKADSPNKPMLEAAIWLTRLRSENLTDRDLENFGDWLRDAPVNVREYLEALAIWEDLGRIDADLDVDAILASSNVRPLHEDFRPARQLSATRWRPAFAAVATVLLIGILLVGGGQISSLFNDDVQIISTAVGEQRLLVLNDGSVLHLNTESVAHVPLDGTTRHVELVAGEALFDVVKNPTRPFTVAVGETVIEVLGTRFNVRRQEESTMVTVIEGRVTVSREIEESIALGSTNQPMAKSELSTLPFSVDLISGQQANVDKEAIQASTVNVEKVVAWTERRLIFEGDGLQKIVSEFNRYNINKVIIGDEALKELRLTGVFGANNADSFLQLLIETQSIEVVTRKDGSRELTQRK